MPDAEQVKLVWGPGQVRIRGSEVPEEMARKEDTFEFVFFFVLITWFSVNGLDWFKSNIQHWFKSNIVLILRAV